MDISVQNDTHHEPVLIKYQTVSVTGSLILSHWSHHRQFYDRSYRVLYIFCICVFKAGQFWIGISDIIEEDRWIYSSDRQPTQVNDFHASQPNQHTSANCVALWKPFHGHWADEPCTTRYNFICESPQEYVYCDEYAI